MSLVPSRCLEDEPSPEAEFQVTWSEMKLIGWIRTLENGTVSLVPVLDTSKRGIWS